MPETRRYFLHARGPALWPHHKPESEVRELKMVTPPAIFETTYQLNAVVPGGTIFKQDWFAGGKNRYHPRDPRYRKGGSNGVIRRWISADTAHTATKKGWEESQQTAAYSAFGVWDLLNDYRLILRYVYRERLEYTDLLPDPAYGTRGAVAEIVEPWYDPDIFAGLLVENADSGTVIIQTLKRASYPWAGELVLPFNPTEDKITRAITASAWFMNGSVLLPFMDPTTAEWQIEYEKELFGFPNTSFKDQVDMTSQMVIWLAARYLSEGLAARMAYLDGEYEPVQTQQQGWKGPS